MSTPKGWPTQEKDQRLIPQFATVEPVHTLQHGLSVLAHQYVAEVATDAAEAGSSAIAIVATAHVAQAGDVIRLTSGALSGREIKVYSTAVDSIVLAEELPSAVATGVTFQILRHKYPVVEPTGEIKISGSFTATEEAVAADGGALPAKVKVAGGYDGSAVQVLATDASGHLQVDVLSMPAVSGGATAAAQIDGTQKTRITSGGSDATVDALGNVLNNLTSQALTVKGSVYGVPLSGGNPVVLRTTDSIGRLSVDVNTMPAISIPAGASTYAAQTDGTQKSQIVDAAGDIADVKLLSVNLDGTDKGLVTNTIIHGETTGGGGGYVDVKVTPSGALNTESTIAGLDAAVLGQDVMANSLPVVIASDQTTIPVSMASAPLPTNAATETTLSALNGKVIACDTGNVTIASSSLPTGAATEVTLSALNGKVTVCDTGSVTIASSALPTGAATETTLSALNSKMPSQGQALMAASVPVVISSDQTAIPVSGSFTAGKLSVVDLLDANILDTSSTNIPGSASSPVEVIASTAAEIKAIQLLDTTGAFVGVYVGGSGSEVLKFVMGPGSDQTIEHNIPAASRVSLKRLDSTAAVSSGIVAFNCLG